VTAQRLSVQPEGYEPGVLYAIAFGRRAEPVPLRAKAGGPSGLLLDLRHAYMIVPGEPVGSYSTWRVATKAYEYRILDSEEDELLVYHWQPDGVARGPDYPHLHVSATISAKISATTRQPLPLDRRHIPTGRVSLEAVVRLLIAEFGIGYRHRNWLTRLNLTENVFRREMTQFP
jgi:hypothetical protein